MLSGDDWGQLLEENPQVLWSLVADVVKAVKAGEGERKTGRRPAVSVGSLDELYDILFPSCYVTDPFGIALGRHLADTGISQRALAAWSGLQQATIARLISGRLTPSLDHIEAAAAGLKLRPTYFAEYRALKLGQLVTQRLMADPLLSAESVRRLFGATA